MDKAYFPQAKKKLLPGRDTATAEVRLLTIHTAVSNSDDLYGSGRGHGGTYAHFYSPKTGPLIQYQEIGKMARADNFGNSFTVSVENWDGAKSPVPPLTSSQVENLAQLFAWLVTNHGLPNRIATVDNPSGLGWHRLGITGNFGTYDPKDLTTWSRAQTGLNFSSAFGKLCPGDARIAQIKQIYIHAQQYINAAKRIERKKGEKMFVIYRPLPTDAKTRQYAVVGSNFFMPFTGESAAKNLIAQLGGAPALKVTNNFWTHCQKAAKN